MKKLKINNALAIILILASMFAGWGTFLLTTLLILIFTELDEKTRNIIASIATFFLSLTIVSLLWDLIVGGTRYILNSADGIVSVINAFRDPLDQIEGLSTKFTIPVSHIVNIIDNGVNYCFTFVKVFYLIRFFTNKQCTQGKISSYINDYMQAVSNYIYNYDAVEPTPAAQPVEDPVVQPVEQPTVKPVEQPVSQAAEQPATQPVEQPEVPEQR